MCANRPITDEERRAVYATPPALAPIETAVPPEYETQSHGDTEGAPEATTEHTEDTEPAAPDYYVTPDFARDKPVDPAAPEMKEVPGFLPRLERCFRALLVNYTIRNSGASDAADRLINEGIELSGVIERLVKGGVYYTPDAVLQNPPFAPETETQRRKDAEPESTALADMGFRVLEDRPRSYAFSIDTPFEGARVFAQLLTTADREHAAYVAVLNARGLGWHMDVAFHDMGRWVAKSLIRNLAIETRSEYCHRSQKSHKRAVARAIARREAMKEAGE